MKRLLLATTLLATPAFGQDITQWAVPYSGGPGVAGWLAIGPCPIGQVLGWPNGAAGAPACVVGGGGGGGGVNVAGTAPITATTAAGTATVGLNIDNRFAVVLNNLALASIPAGQVIGNAGASAAEPGGTTLTAMFDRAFGTTSGTVLQRSASAWIAGPLALANLAAIPQNTVLGSVTAGSNPPVALTQSQLTGLCNTFTTTLSGCVPSTAGATTTYLRADGTWAPPTIAISATPITGGTPGNFLFNSANTVGERTPTQTTSTLDVFTSTLKGLAPSSGGGTANFLRADGTWVPPPTSGAAGIIKAPTTTFLTSGSGTYTVPANVTWLKVSITGAGGGGSGSGVSTSTSVPGTATTFGPMSAGGGGFALSSAPNNPQPGTGGSSVAGCDVSVAGGSGGYPSAVPGSDTVAYFGGVGGVGFYGGGGFSGPALGYGGGGHGAAIAVAGGVGGAGGGAGAYCQRIISTLLATYAYSVGVGGTGGPNSGTGSDGYSGAGGAIVVEEHYDRTVDPTGSLVTVNGLTGAANIVAGNAITVTTASPNITVASPAFASGTPGSVPASGGGTTNFLRADGTWAAPPGGAAGITSINTQTGPAYTIAAGTGISVANTTNTGTINNTGVTSLNTLTGGLTLAAGTNITITPSGGNTLTIAASGAGGGGGLLALRTFTATGTYTPTAGMVNAIVECVGGGGGGGGAASTGSNASGAGGGGSGGYSRKFVTAADIGASKPVTIGAAGTAGTAAPGGGGNGGATSLGTLCVANGGTGGFAAGDSAGVAGGAGGSITGAAGDLIVAGNGGGSGMGSTLAASVVAFGGVGAGSFMGGGAMPHGGYSSGNGLPAPGFGGGGSGGHSNNASSAAGGAGAGGVIVITEFK